MRCMDNEREELGMKGKDLVPAAFKNKDNFTGKSIHVTMESTS